MNSPTFNPSQMFAEAVAEFKSGRLDKAAALCRVIIEKAPPNPICLHLMGVILHKQHKPDEAEQWIRKSLDLQPNAIEVNFNLGLALLAQEKNSDALFYFKKAAELNPSYAAAYFQMGNVYKNLHEYDEATKAYEQCLAHNPNHDEALNSLGVVLCQQNRHQAALEYFSKALLIRPDFPEALSNMGVAYLELDRPERTKEFCEKAIAIRPHYTAALNNLGNAYKTQGNYKEAIEYYERALTINPDLVEAKNNLGLSMMYGMSAIDAALVCFREVLKTNPHHPQALNNLGITLCHQGLFEEGIECYRKAIAAQPDYTEAISNLACALRATGHVQEAIQLYEQTIRQKPSLPEAHNNYAMILLSVGRFDEGFQEYEWRWKTKYLRDSYREFRQPLWKGEDISGKTLLVHAEQGFGDTLQFGRYIQLIKQKNINVIAEVPTSLVRIIQSMQGVDQVFAFGDPLPDFDYHCPTLSLPAAFKTQPDSIPAPIPYLFPIPEDIKIWKERTLKKGGEIKVGLVWSGNPRLHSFDLASIDRQRSMPPHYLMPLAKIAHVQFYSLQKDGPQAPHEFPLIDFMNECKDFADTAALISQLDLVIGVDTSVIHLAGALGKPVWLLNRYDSCWRWGYERNDSPWYPNLRQFRQPHYGNWEYVIEQVCRELDTLANGVASKE